MANDLFKEVTELTGLPSELISDELVTILEKVGSNPHSMTLDDLRMAMAEYLVEIVDSVEGLEPTGPVLLK